MDFISVCCNSGMCDHIDCSNKTWILEDLLITTFVDKKDESRIEWCSKHLLIIVSVQYKLPVI